MFDTILEKDAHRLQCNRVPSRYEHSVIRAATSLSPRLTPAVSKIHHLYNVVLAQCEDIIFVIRVCRTAMMSRPCVSES